MPFTLDLANYTGTHQVRDQDCQGSVQVATLYLIDAYWEGGGGLGTSQIWNGKTGWSGLEIFGQFFLFRAQCVIAGGSCWGTPGHIFAVTVHTRAITSQRELYG